MSFEKIQEKSNRYHSDGCLDPHDGTTFLGNFQNHKSFSQINQNAVFSKKLTFSWILRLIFIWLLL